MKISESATGMRSKIAQEQNLTLQVLGIHSFNRGRKEIKYFGR